MTQMLSIINRMVTSIMCITQTEMINLGMEDTLTAMFTRWEEAIAAGEVPSIESHQWYGSLYLSTDEYGNTIIVAPVEEYDDNGIIDYVKNVIIPAWAYEKKTIPCAACNYAEGTESIYGTLYCTSCAQV